jgi:Holliday junction resolvasome RuvABC endonuclease subunit
MQILALDVATRVGVCVGSSGADPIAFEEYLGKASEDERFSNVLRLTQNLIRDHRPDLVAVEAAIGGKTSSPYMTGLVACVRGVCANRRVRCESVHSGSVRRHFLGKALTTRHFPHLSKPAAKKAIKQEVIKRCHLLGFDVTTDNEADAVATWDYAQAKWGSHYQSQPLGGLFSA